LRSLNESDFRRVYFHPQYEKQSSLEEVLGLYAWHGKHHLAHIQNLKSRKKW
jgi:hypothetical protein